MKVTITYLALIVGSFISIQAQPIPQKGVPLLKGFTPAQYDHKGKIWDIDTAPNGIVYMAADKGLIEYDGETWRHYNGSDGINRAVVVVNDSVIYTGSDLDFGVWKKNEYSEFEYTSLYPFKEDLNTINEEFWNVHILNGTALFVSESNIYVYKDQNLTKIPAPTHIVSSFQLDGQIYIADEQEGIFKLENLSPVKLYDYGRNTDIEIVGMYEVDGEHFFVTQNAGLFTVSNKRLFSVDNQLSEELKAANVFSFESLYDSYLAFGTILNGLYITDKEGNLIHLINKNKGLQNNTILSLHYRPNGKLWLGMDYGITSVDLDYEFTVIYDNAGDFGTAHDALLKENKFYLGTNQGLYTTRWDNLDNNNEFYNFNLINGSEGQVWSLDVIHDRIWVSHDRGLFHLDDGRLSRIRGSRGAWTVEPYNGYVLAGTYNGIDIYQQTGNKWEYLRQMELIAGSCDEVIVDEGGYLWVNIPNFGVIRADINEDLYPENRQIFKSEQFGGANHYLEKGESGVLVMTDEYKFEYNPGDSTFHEQPVENHENRIKDILLRDGRKSRLNSEYEFYPAYNGFALKDLTIGDRKTDTTSQILFRNIWAFNNDERKSTHDEAEISYRYNNLRLQAIVPNQENVLYQFWTEDSEWSDLSPKNTFDIIGMNYGDHTIKARAVVDGLLTSTATFGVKILPPWYRSWYMYVVYFGLLLGLIYLIYWWLDLSLNKQKKQLLTDQRESLKDQKELFQEQLKIVEQERLRAEYKNLKAELKNKTVELATKAKENDEKKKVLQALKEKLEKIELNPASLKHNLKEIKQMIDTNLGPDDNTFEIQIDELHQDFFDTLREEFSDLTRYDLRLCAYIKIGFDSKEIANLLNIKPSSVYISRSRLRKKLGIETDEDLHSYLNSI